MKLLNGFYKQMKESKEVYKFFESKPILIITNAGFRYHTSDMEVLDDDSIFFTDNRSQQIIIKFSEINFIQEVGDGN